MISFEIPVTFNSNCKRILIVCCTSIKISAGVSTLLRNYTLTFFLKAMRRVTVKVTV